MHERDSGSLKPEEADAVAQLQRHADRLRDALDGTAEMHVKANKAEDELERFTARDRLQRDLRDTADASARLDAGLVRLAGEWKFEVDPASPLRDAAPPVVRRPQPPARPNRPEPKENQQVDRLDVGDALTGTWTDARGDYDATASVTSVDGNRITIRITPSFNSAGYSIVVVLNGAQATIVSFVSHESNPSAFKPQNMHGTFRNGVLDAGGPAEKTDRNGVKSVSEWRFKLQLPERAKARAANQIDDIFPLGSTYTGRWMGAGGWQNIIASVTSVKGGIATVRWENDFGTWDSQMELIGARIKMRTCTGIGRSKQGGARSEITNIDMFGPADAAARGGTIRITGTWDWFNHETRTGKRGVITALELDRK